MPYTVMKSPGQAHTASYKEVRFSQPLIPSRRRARSVASSKPALDPTHYSARVVQRASKENAESEYSVYINQSRSLLESQRLNFERERLLFAEERKLWDMERVLLKSRIAELEAAVRKDNVLPNNDSNLRLDPGRFELWQPDGSQIATGEHHVWEGPIPGSQRPTRVFPAEGGSERESGLHIPPTEANGFGVVLSLDAALSPQLFDRSGGISMPVPIEKVDSRLDGITLKSTALPPNVVAKVMTPPTSLSPVPSPPKGEPHSSSKLASDARPSPGLVLKLSDLGPPHENLTRDAGHTPMAMLGTETEGSRQSPAIDHMLEDADTEGEDEDAQEGPLAPVVTKQPMENGDSYFPTFEEDPALTGPLTLENDEEKDSSFLSQLDQKLLDEARKVVLGGATSSEGAENDATAGDADEEPDPELKLKASKNFGTALGQY